MAKKKSPKKTAKKAAPKKKAVKKATKKSTKKPTNIKKKISKASKEAIEGIEDHNNFALPTQEDIDEFYEEEIDRNPIDDEDD